MRDSQRPVVKYVFGSTVPSDAGGARVRLAYEEEGDEEVNKLSNGQKELVVRFGKPNEMTRRKLITLVRKIVKAAKVAHVKRLILPSFDDLYSRCSPQMAHNPTDLAELVVTNIEMANYEFVAYKSTPKDGWPFIEEVVLTGIVAERAGHYVNGIERGKIIGAGINLQRDLGNTPASDMTPDRLVFEAGCARNGLSIRLRSLNIPDMQELGMGGVLGVGQGSVNKPRFIIMEYMAGDLTEKPIVFVGKGVTFDSGGISIKPGKGMDEMKLDMLGGASVIAAVVTAARLGVKKNIVALVPAVENMPSGSATKPGDILTSLSGRTMEVLNTDAEGRLILADALAYAEKFYDPKLIVSVATLTGAICVALGSHASGLFTSDDSLAATVTAFAEESGDYVWRMPMWEEYDDEIKSAVADVANVGKSRYGDATHAAKFLEKVGNAHSPLAHLDIASRMTSVASDCLAEGAAGDPVRLLIRIIEQY